MENNELVLSIFEAVENKTPYNELKIAVADLLRIAIFDTRSNCLPKIQKHPLGFLAYRWQLGNGRALRIHVWDKKFHWTQKPTWQIHDHVFEFNSVVLVGKIQNKRYRIVPISNHKRIWSLYQVTYDTHQSKMEEIRAGISVDLIQTSLQATGSRYSMPAYEFHRSTLRSDFAVTILSTRQGDFAQSKPLVIGDGVFRKLAFDRDADISFHTDAITKQVLHHLGA